MRSSPQQPKADPAAVELIDRAAGCLTVSPDGRYLALCSENIGAVRAWRLDEDRLPQPVFDDIKARASAVGFTGDGKSLLIGGFDGSIAIRLVEPVGPGSAGPWTIAANRGKVQRIDSTRSRRFLLLLDELNHAQIWDLKDRSCGRLPGAWTAGVFLGDDELILSTAADAPTPSRPVSPRRPRWCQSRVQSDVLRPLERLLPGPRALAFEGLTLSSDGSRVAATANPSQVPLVCVWETKTGKLTHWITQIEDPVLSLSFSSDARHLLTAGDSPEAKLWDLAGARVNSKPPPPRFRRS